MMPTHYLGSKNSFLNRYQTCTGTLYTVGDPIWFWGQGSNNSGYGKICILNIFTALLSNWYFENLAVVETFVTFQVEMTPLLFWGQKVKVLLLSNIPVQWYCLF